MAGVTNDCIWLYDRWVAPTLPQARLRGVRNREAFHGDMPESCIDPQRKWLKSTKKPFASPWQLNMAGDPEFNDVGKDKSAPGRPWLRWLLVYPLLGLAGCHMLMTGSPVPLWYTEQLDHPVAVNEVTDKSMILADGRSVSLRFIKRIPKADPVFLRALKHGVEAGRDGETFGLITVYPYCGNDPYRWYTFRINLSDLAGYMDPDGIDDSVVHPDEIRWLKENESRTLDRHGLPYLVMNKAHKMREIYKAGQERSREAPFVIRSFSRDQTGQ